MTPVSADQVRAAVLAALRHRATTHPGLGWTPSALFGPVLEHLGAWAVSGVLTSAALSAALRRLQRLGLVRLESRRLGWHLTEAGRAS